MKQVVEEKFKEIFGEEGKVKTYFSPISVNLMGENIAENYILPATLSTGIYATIRKREDRTINFYSLNAERNGISTTSLDKLTYNENDTWINYVKAIIWALKNEKFNIEFGFDMVYYNEIPTNLLHFPTASIEILTIRFLQKMFDLEIDNAKLIEVCRKAQNEFIGKECSIKNQFIIANGKKDTLLYMNAKTLDYKYVPIKLNNMKIVIINANRWDDEEKSQLNLRKAECIEAVEQLKKGGLDIQTLSELTPEEYEKSKSLISNEDLQKRVKHIAYENQRIEKSIKALENNDIETFGKIMIESHNSLKENFEITGNEIDTIFEEVLKQKGVIGTKMVRIGLENCVICIVEEAKVNSFTKNIEIMYKEKIGNYPKLKVLDICDGPKIV